MSESVSPRIFVVIPVFNEGEAVTAHVQEILDHLANLETYRFQILVVDDGSTDHTAQEMRRFSQQSPQVSLLSLTRNFGKEAAIQAGLEHLGDDAAAVIVMDSDLQHPPSLIPQMIAIWEQGVDVVEAYKTHRGRESRSTRWMARWFYRMFRALSGMDLDNQSDFKLLDQHVLAELRRLKERDRFFRGLVHWMGFATAHLPFDVPERKHGQSRWSRLRLWRYSMSAITSFSAAPLQFITLLGVLTFLLSVVVTGKALYDKLIGEALGGFTTVILLLLFIGSALMISLGLLGAYVAKIHDEVKRRPSYLIDWRKCHIDAQKGKPDA